MAIENVLNWKIRARELFRVGSKEGDSVNVGDVLVSWKQIRSTLRWVKGLAFYRRSSPSSSDVKLATYWDGSMRKREQKRKTSKGRKPGTKPGPVRRGKQANHK
jgi:hypothetical protein